MRITAFLASTLCISLSLASFDSSSRTAPMSVSELERASDLISLMRCEGVGMDFQPAGVTYGSMRFSIEELYKGEWRNNVHVLQRGPMSAHGIGNCEVGRLYVLFLRSGIVELTVEGSEIGSIHRNIPGVFQVVGGKQGMWAVEESGVEKIQLVKARTSTLRALLTGLLESE